MERRNEGEYLIRPGEDEDGAGEIAGTGGLLIEWDTKTGKPAIWLRRKFWGREYSGERASAMIELAFERLDLDLVAIPVQTENEKSCRAVAKYVESYGGQYDGIIRNSTVRPDGEIIDHHRYTITQDQYQRGIDE